MIWFTSDPHFGHKNIIEYCHRPWSDIKKMNQGLIDNWNALVKEEDQVYLLGDVSFVDNEWTGSLLRKLHGVIYHIKGNHDKKLKVDRFVWTRNFHIIHGPVRGPNTSDP
jgi:calcineurin-like phosphoesterase family protein